MAEEEKFSKNEVSLILFWRDRCHHNEYECPLSCINDTSFCHILSEKLIKMEKDKRIEEVKKNDRNSQ